MKRILAALAVLFLACRTHSSAEPAPSPGGAPAVLDADAVVRAAGGTPEVSGNVVKVSFPRKDTPVQIDRWDAVPPFMGLTSYVAFTPAARVRS
jgi:hypothetical protein